MLVLRMKETFTQQADTVLILAQQEARRSNRSFVGTEQILIGLIDEGLGLAAQMLTSKGIDRTRVIEETERIIGAHGPGASSASFVGAGR
jgi:ATP-dependent Clp protease ATP-binding subunit ClpC